MKQENKIDNVIFVVWDEESDWQTKVDRSLSKQMPQEEEEEEEEEQGLGKSGSSSIGWTLRMWRIFSGRTWVDVDRFTSEFPTANNILI